MWIVERMRYPTDQPTNRPTDTASYRGALSHLKTVKMLTSNEGEPLKAGLLLQGSPVFLLLKIWKSDRTRLIFAGSLQRIQKGAVKVG